MEMQESKFACTLLAFIFLSGCSSEVPTDAQSQAVGAEPTGIVTQADGQNVLPFAEPQSASVAGKTLAVIDAEIGQDADGVLFAVGGISSGFTVYVDKGGLKAEYNAMTLNRFKVSSSTPIPTGKVRIEVETRYDAMERMAPANLNLTVNGEQVAQGRIERSVPAIHTASETFDVGKDLGSPVALDYYDRAPFAFNGSIEKIDIKALAEELINPLSDLWFMAVQNDLTSYSGDFDGGEQRIYNSLKLQPVMSVPLTDDYNMIVRPVFQIQSYKYPDFNLVNTTPPIAEDSFELDFKRIDGLGDTILLTTFGPSEPSGQFIFAGGPAFILPTATDDELAILQNNTWAMGPSVTGIYIGDHWVIGAFAQHWFGIGNKTQKVRINIPSNDTNFNVAVNGDDLNLTDLQYILRYRYSAQTNIGMAPNITINWNESGNDKLTLPIGIGFDTMAMAGPLPIKWGIEMQYYVNQPDAFGPV
jgi:hypothetical protein